MEEQTVSVANATVKVCEAYIDALEENKELRRNINIFSDRFDHIEDNYGYWDHDKQKMVVPVGAINKWIEEFQDAIRRT